jgi:phosphoribosylformylglycinamidine synthase
MLKPEILDPQGQAIVRALPTLGLAGVRSVRQGKRFELELDGLDREGGGAPSAAQLAEVERIAGTLLANPVIEDFAVRVEP